MSTPSMNWLGRKGNGKALLVRIPVLFLIFCPSPSTSGLKKQWCPEIVELIESMWSQEPHDRPSISEVVGSLEELHAQY